MKKESLYKKDPDAEALIQLVLSTPNPTTRNARVASWLREYVAAWQTGCTGLSGPPDGPSLRPLREPGETSVEVRHTQEDERPEDYWREARHPDPEPETDAERFGWPAFPSLDERRAT